MKSPPVVHPFLFAMFPVLSVLAATLGYLSPTQAIRPMLFVLFVTAIILLIMYWLYKDRFRAGLLTSIIVIVLLNYGYSYRLPKEIYFLGITTSRHLLILSFWIIFFGILSSNWLWQRVRPNVITNFLNITSSLTFLYSIYLLATFWIAAAKDPLTTWERPPNLNEDKIRLAKTSQPDIYYIILDSYARNDILKEIYGFDNASFIHDLAKRGFYIANKSYSNYDETQLSLASSLNFEYLDYLSFASGVSSSRYPLGNLILDSRVRSMLEDAGYDIYLSGEYLFAEISDPAVVFYSPEIKRLNTFESLLLESTMFEILIEEADVNISTYTYKTHRQKILNGFDEVQLLVNKKNSKFVFLHIIAPHPPFVFDRDGNPIEPDWEYTIFDAAKYGGDKEYYIDGYRNQVMYINKLVIKMIDKLLKESATPPIIILQADHGPAALMGTSLETSCLKERFSILNAYYFPSNKTGDLYPTITPVNSFRVLFNTYFNTQLNLLPDQSYFSWGNRYQYINVSNQVNVPCEVLEK